MRTNIFRQELRMNRKSFLSWLAALLILTFFFTLMYSTIASQMTDFLKILDNFPKEFAQAFGVELLRFGNILGFFSFILVFVLLAASIQAMNLGLSTLSAEVRDKTADFLYAKPVSRNAILAQKTLAVLAQIVALDLVYLPVTYLILFNINAAATPDMSVPIGTYLLLGVALILLQLVFASMGLFVSSFMKRIRTVLPISMGVIFFFYFLNMLNETLERVELSYLTPFAYFNLSGVLRNGAYETKYVVLSFVLVLLFTTLAWAAYSRKDLPAI